MEEKTTRQELNESLYREDHKLDIIDSLLYFLFLCIFIMLILVFSIIDCKAAVTHEYDITKYLCFDFLLQFVMLLLFLQFLEFLLSLGRL